MARTSRGGLDGQPVSYKTTIDRVLVVRRRSNIKRRGIQMAQGRFMSSLESDAGGRYACWGDIADRLFANESASGRKSESDRGAGSDRVMEKRSSWGCRASTTRVIIPIPQLLTGYARNPDLDQVKVTSLDGWPEAKEELRGLDAKGASPGAGDRIFLPSTQEQIEEGV